MQYSGKSSNYDTDANSVYVFVSPLSLSLSFENDECNVIMPMKTNDLKHTHARIHTRALIKL